MDVRLNLGCGSTVPKGWVNVDYALGARLSRLPLFRSLNRKIKFFNLDWDDEIFIHNLTKKFPWEDNSIDAIYSSHALEHFTKEQGLFLFREAYRVLKPGSVIRFVLPDFRYYVDEYMKGNLAADDFLKTIGVLYRHRHPLKDKLAPFFMFPHKCMYDTPSLIKAMRGVGFKAAERLPFESDIADIEQIELPGRVKNAVIVEGVKV